MQKKSIVCFLLIISIVLCSVFVSCGEAVDDPENAETDAGDATGIVTEASTVDNTVDEVPEMKWPGEEFSILTFDVDYSNNIHVFDEASDDPVEYAKYKTILSLEERFGIDIVEYVESYDYVNTTYRSMISTGADDYDVMFPDDLHAHYFAEEGVIYDYDSLVYIDLSKDYWDQSLLKYTTVGDRVYYAYGTCDFTYYDFTHCLAFNKNLINTLGCENPYDLVYDGTWTMDKMFEMCNLATFDDGDGVMSPTDSYGLVSSGKQILPNFWISGGTMTVVLDENNLPVVNIDGNQRLSDVVDKCFKMFWDGEVWYVSTSTIGNQSADHELIFESGNTLFADYTFHYLSQLRDCEAEFGILPYPKYDKEQKDYYSRVEAGVIVAVVPITNPTPDISGAVIEAWASKGYEEILPAYYESVLKRKVSRDEESQGMLDLIFKTRVYDLGDTWYCDQIRHGLFSGMWNKNQNRLSSYYASFKRMIDKTINETIEAYTR